MRFMLLQNYGPIEGVEPISHAVRAHLLEMDGRLDDAIEDYEAAAQRTASAPEQHYLMTRAARLRHRGA